MIKKRILTNILCLALIAGIFAIIPDDTFARGRSTSKKSKATKSSSRSKAKSRSSKASSGKKARVSKKRVKTSRKSRSVRGKRSRYMTAAPRRAPGVGIPPDRVSEIQTALKREGYYQEEPNGQYDRTTIEAMTNYQKEKNLRTTGYPTAESLQKLGLSKRRQSASTNLPAANKEEKSGADPADQAADPNN